MIKLHIAHQKVQARRDAVGLLICHRRVRVIPVFVVTRSRQVKIESVALCKPLICITNATATDSCSRAAFGRAMHMPSCLSKRVRILT